MTIVPSPGSKSHLSVLTLRVKTDKWDFLLSEEVKIGHHVPLCSTVDEYALFALLNELALLRTFQKKIALLRTEKTKIKIFDQKNKNIAPPKGLPPPMTPKTF